MKYIVKTLKEIRIVKEYSIEAESVQEAKNIACDLENETDDFSPHELLDIQEDCSYFDILEVHLVES